VARAKRTNRAEARRRYRAQIAAESTADAPDSPSTTARPTGEPSARNARAVAEPPRTGLRYAFRASLRTPNLREDFEHVDEIVGSRGLWAAVASTLATALVLIATSGADTLSRIAAPYLLLPPPIIAVFIAGFFARRASYVNGGIVAIVAAVALQAVFALNPASLGLVATANQNNTGANASPSPAATPSPAASQAPSTSPGASASAGSASASPNASPAPSAQPVTEEAVRAEKTYLTTQSITSIPLAILLASAAAWYRRFLRLGNPNRPPPRGGQRGRANNRRR
jgi:hypothetical protein